MTVRKIVSVRGDTITLPFSMTPPTGYTLNVPLTGITCTVRKPDDSVLVAKTVGDGITVATETATEVAGTIVITAANTSSLAASELRCSYDVQVTEGNGRVTTILRGPLVLALDATR